MNAARVEPATRVHGRVTAERPFVVDMTMLPDRLFTSSRSRDRPDESESCL